MNIPVDVVAIFNTVGEIKPTFIRLENEDHTIGTYKIANVLFSKEEKYAGIYNIVYICDVQVEEILKQIKIAYNLQHHKWFLYNH